MSGGGTLFFAAGFSQNVGFGAAGVLELADSKHYTGKIRGFSTSGATALDLNDIAFDGSTTVSFSGTAVSGTLTVTHGADHAGIKLIGDYLGSTFTLAGDHHGGTIVTDPTAPAAPAHPFIAAMAALAAPAAGPAAHAAEPWRAALPRLVAPGSHFA